ncbi:hypothetical protein PA25_31520 [Pseudoalteromonas sp. A25]|uniref:hypothetical protein n=1 Tax=Pseudoalteromonas sp. A25 TaxID=116092 RepID=UPI0012605098|nr:hypothetical protein [Pseudoalteromonas sp. A25]BBN83167.1 hypothetical protein PA25_31520 [Pseudoalteromonas sp. A25]
MKKIALLSVVLASATAFAQPVDQQALAACTLIKKDFKRLVCFDKVMANQPINIEQTITQNAPPELSDEERFGMSKKLLKEKTDYSEAQQINASVIEVKKSPLGTRLFKLDNGQSWKQLDSGAFYAKKGDDIQIERGTLGSFIMTKAGSNRSIRVKRVD